MIVYVQMSGVGKFRIKIMSFFQEIAKCQSQKVHKKVLGVSAFKSVKSLKCQNWEVSELESIRIGKC